tara:strand:+ start:607 stop:828 length:222 start_codon:yes stop_codon:yes gene_type:complete
MKVTINDITTVKLSISSPKPKKRLFDLNHIKSDEYIRVLGLNKKSINNIRDKINETAIVVLAMIDDLISFLFL